MWIQVGRFHFNTDNINFVQIEMNDSGDAPKKVHLHFRNDRDNFALYNADAAHFLSSLGTISQEAESTPLLSYALAVGER